MFQFLIGTLRTDNFKTPHYHYAPVSIPHRYAENYFPSGIYTVMRCVSIPHRYAENDIEYESPPAESEVSIPHRYAENHAGQYFPGKFGLVSIPHRYAENSRAKSCSATMPKRVSIPHRYAENPECQAVQGFCVFQFQFLIGTLKTGCPTSLLPGRIGFQFLIGTLKT